MKYPRQIMKISDLEQMGFPKDYLLRAYRSRGQTFATKMNPAKRNSPIIFNTEGLDQWMQQEIKAQQSAKRRAAII